MSSLATHRRFRAAVLVLYALVAGVDQGWHYFAHADACHGLHAAAHACSGGCCAKDSPFAAYRRAQLETEGGRLTLRSGAGAGHKCHECSICQALTQMVGDEPPAEPQRYGNEALDTVVPVAQQRVALTPERRTDARGPPSLLATA